MIRKFLEALLIRAPIAFAIFFVSIKQNNSFSSNQIIIIGSIFSSSVLYSILFLQPLGNIFNKMIGKVDSLAIKALTDYRLLILYLFAFAFILSLIFFRNINLVLAFNLATAQAIFQWCISYLTFKSKKKHLYYLCAILVLELAILLCFFDFQTNTVQSWICFLILSYYIPSILFFSLNLKFVLAIKYSLHSIFDFLKLFLSSASFFTILSIFFWMLEFYPRTTNIFSFYFTSNFNVYMTFSIGLVGAIDTVLNQMYLKKYLELSSTDKVGFIKYFFRIIKINTFLYFSVFLILILLNQYYWKFVFDINRFNNYKIFYFLFFIEVIRILCFHSFNLFFYLDRLDLMKNTIIVICLFTIILLLITHILILTGVQYLILFSLIIFYALVSNLFKIKSIE